MRLWLWALFATLLLMGCDKKDSQLAHDSLLYCIANAPFSFNPQLVISTETLDATAQQLYDRLLDIDPVSHTPQPALAIAWQRSDDGLRYRFNLRNDVAFHHTAWFTPTRLFNAADVAFSFNRLLDVQHPYHQVSGGDYPFFVAINWSALVKEVRVINEYEVEFVLNHANVDFLNYLASDYAVILSAEYGEQLLSLGTPQLLDQQPVGTGPFLLDLYRTDEFIRYHRHPHYWQDPATMQQLVFDITPKSSKRLAKLLTGECDAMANPAASQLQVIQDHPDLALSAPAGVNVSVLALNTEKAPFNDIQVRQAINLALNRTDIVRAVYFGQAQRAPSLLPVWVSDHPLILSTPTQNVEQARKLLAQAGVSKGLKMTLLMPAGARAYNPDGLKTGQLIQQQLAAIGIKVTLRDLDEQILRTTLLSGQQDAVLTGWSADTPSPDNILRNLLSCQSIAASTNASRWCRPKFETLLDNALSEPDPERRAAYYQQAQTLAATDVALLPLVHSQRRLSYRKTVSGLQLLPYGGVDFHLASKD